MGIVLITFGVIFAGIVGVYWLFIVRADQAEGTALRKRLNQFFERTMLMFLIPAS